MELHQKKTGKRVEVWFDGGIRNGWDVFKALALGADLVCLGRPVLWGLACGGEAGVRQILEIVNEELKEAMRQAGCTSVREIRGNLYKRDELLPKM